MTKKEEYRKKLLDPRWQKKRLEILERDSFTCKLCGDSQMTLHVHHLYYERGNEPWEYPLEALATLCAQIMELLGNTTGGYVTGDIAKRIDTIYEGNRSVNSVFVRRILLDLESHGMVKKMDCEKPVVWMKV